MKINFKFKAANLILATLIVASPHAALSQAPCFTDDFEAGHANNWTPLTASRWEVSSDDGSLRYFLNTTNYDSPDGIRMGEISLTGSGPWGDFTFECFAKSADAAIGGEAADLCIAFGYQDEDSYYYINFNATPGLTQLHRIHDGNLATLATYDQATFSDGNYHTLRVERSGNQILAFFDGNRLFAVNDSFFGAGQIGIGSYNDSGYFDDVQIAGDACSQPFTDIAAPLSESDLVSSFVVVSAAWGDYDNDGDLDVLLTGSSNSMPFTKIYRHDAENFVDVNAALPGVMSGSVAWGDYDNDNDLDILLTGDTGSGNIAKIYRNDQGDFVDINAALPGVSKGATAWADYDNDGDLDILLSGGTNSGDVAKIYRNEGGSFVDINAALPDVAFNAVAWGDYDSDGDLDVLATGGGAIIPGVSNPGISQIYRNDAGSFVNIAADLTGVMLGSAAWGDYDNDGDLDVLLTGAIVLDDFFSRVSKIYRNDGGTFVSIPNTLTGVWQSSATWGDYDNDGDLDILLTGSSSAGAISKVYRNDQGAFVDISAALSGIFNGVAA